MLLELTLQGRYREQQTINRWTYLAGGTPAAVSFSFALASAFGLIGTGSPPAYSTSQPFGTMLSFVHETFEIETGFVRALYDVLDFYERPYPGGAAGGNEGVAASPVLSFGFRTNRVRTDIARGTKRIAGVSEDAMGQGGVVDAGFITGLSDFAELMSEVLEYDDEGSTLTFTPVVCQKEEYTPPSGKPAYRYYDTLAEQLEHTAVGVTWTPYDTIRSQVSRQYGRGA